MARMLIQLEADRQTIEGIEKEKCTEILDSIYKTGYLFIEAKDFCVFAPAEKIEYIYIKE